jgi:DNA-binding transcriptional LysR family regulator
MTSGIDQAIAIREEKYDFNFTIQAMISGDNRYDYTVSHHDQYCLVFPREHPLTERPLDFANLADEPFSIIRMADAPLLHSHIVEICKHRGYKPKIISHYNRAEAVLLSVAAGAGISILPQEIIQVYCSNQIAYIPIPGEDCILPSVIIWKKNITNSPAVKFREVVLELFPKNAIPARLSDMKITLR